MIPVAIGVVVIVAGLALAFRVLTGHRLMATYDPARVWHEGRLRALPPKRLWGEVQPPVEPINTWTNLAYYVAGWAVFASDGTPAAAAFAVWMSVLAVGSALFHGTATRWGQRADHMGMHAAFWALAAHALLPAGDWGAALVLAAGWGGLVFGTRFFEHRLNVAMGVFLAVTLVLGFQRVPLLAGIGLGLFAVSAALSLWLDRSGSNLLRGWLHGAWHLGTAAAAALSYLAQG